LEDDAEYADGRLGLGLFVPFAIFVLFVI